MKEEMKSESSSLHLSLHTLIQCGKSNMLSQDFYGQLQRSFQTSLTKAGDTSIWQRHFNVIRLHSTFMRSKEFAEAKLNQLRREIQNRMITSFVHLTAYDLLHLLYNQ